jgi:hypothetical protein
VCHIDKTFEFNLCDFDLTDTTLSDLHAKEHCKHNVTVIMLLLHVVVTVSAAILIEGCAVRGQCEHYRHSKRSYVNTFTPIAGRTGHRENKPFENSLLHPC